MQFEPTAIAGAFLVRLERREDDRGFFARSFCRREFEAHGLDPCVTQCNVSFNRVRGTVRGMHYQAPPHEEAKLVRCTRGAVYDVLVDLRPGSPTFRRWTAAELSAENHDALYVPPGLAHGFQTLEPETELLYQMSASYAPGARCGVRWDDPAFGIEWPLPVATISAADRTYPDFDPARSPS